MRRETGRNRTLSSAAPAGEETHTRKHSGARPGRFRDGHANLPRRQRYHPGEKELTGFMETAGFSSARSERECHGLRRRLPA